MSRNKIQGQKVGVNMKAILSLLVVNSHALLINVCLHLVEITGNYFRLIIEMEKIIVGSCF
jgi:hypothetical protein